MAFVSKIFLPQVSYLQLGLLGVFLGILAQLGDLAESLIKRDVGVKDSGAIPGLGGVLDVTDSILFTAPFLFYYLTAVLRIQ
jgi:phosphatidate cytidylyltransferase